MKNKKPLARRALVFFLSIILLSCSTGRQNEVEREGLIIGIKIYEYEKDFPGLFEEWRSLGINAAFISVSLGQDKNFMELAKRNNITTFIILPIFYNPEELQKRPDLFAITDSGEKASEEWVSFICPARVDYRKQRIEYIRGLIKELDPDGISIDFIRYFVYWEKVYPDQSLSSIPNTCFCSDCIQKFQKDTNIMIPQRLVDTRERAKWIAGKHIQEWTDWKCDVITTMVKDIADEARRKKPDILINVHTVPWRENDFGGAIKIIAGQDLVGIASHTDFISPMCYSHMLKRKPAWIHSVAEDFFSHTKSEVIPSIQVKEAYLSETLSVGEFRDSLAEALKPPSRGVVFWSWDALEKDPQKREEIKAFLRTIK